MKNDLYPAPAFFSTTALTVHDNGWHVIPVKPRGKAPDLRKGWTKFCTTPPDERQARDWVKRKPDASIGIACGHVVAVDIDLDDKAQVYRVRQLAELLLGETPLVRVGRAPRCLLVYCAAGPIRSTKIGPVDILANGRQFVAYGIHQNTGQPYQWIGDGTPEDTPPEALHAVTQDAMDAFLAALAPVVGKTAAQPRQKAAGAMKGGKFLGPTFAPDGTVIDGRDTFLWQLAMDAVREGHATVTAVAGYAWPRFQREADMSRPKGDRPGQVWTYQDALKKAGNVLRNGHMPKRRRKGGTWTLARKNAIRVVVERECANGLPRSAVAVNDAMLEHLNMNGQDGFWCSHATIARRTGHSESTVRRARDELVERGIWQDTGQRRPAARRGWVAVLQPNGRLVANLSEVPEVIQENTESCSLSEHRNLTTLPVGPLVTHGHRPQEAGGVAGTWKSLSDLLLLPRSARPSLPMAANSNERLEVVRVAPTQPDLFGGDIIEFPVDELTGWKRGPCPAWAKKVFDIRRAELHLTQEQAAARLDLARPTVANGLNGRYPLGPEAIERLKAFILASGAVA